MKIILITNSYSQMREIVLTRTKALTLLTLFGLTLVGFFFIPTIMSIGWFSPDPITPQETTSISQTVTPSQWLQAQQKIQQLELQLQTAHQTNNDLNQAQQFLYNALDSQAKMAYLNLYKPSMGGHLVLGNSTLAPYSSSSEVFNLPLTLINPLARQSTNFSANPTANPTANPSANPSVTPPSQTLTNSPITSHFGYRLDPILKIPALHQGVDIQAPLGTPIVASADGIVIQAQKQDQYGLMIEIAHAHQVRSKYAHASLLQVKVGDTVKQGQTIGFVGSSGRSTGAHLHYEVLVGNQAIDPSKFIQ